MGPMTNRALGTANVVPVLVYPDVGKAVDWLCEVLGFEEMWRVGNHRARIRFGNGIVAVADAAEEYGRRAPDPAETTHTHGVMLHVDDADAHHDHAHRAGATILTTPTDFPFGRQYTLQDPAGHTWTITQDHPTATPEDWGAITKNP
jgi:uncharacterized glyoxalase superfamily protein PhnB